MIKLGVMFGGRSTEHDVSIVSGLCVLKNLDRQKYEIFPIYIDLQGKWYQYQVDFSNIPEVEVGQKLEKAALEQIQNPIEYVKQMDCIFPVLHGLYGEDGTVQGMLELLSIPYVGCKVLSSSICMDKAYTKIILEKADIPQVNSLFLIKKQNHYFLMDETLTKKEVTLGQIEEKIQQDIGYPIFVKPSNSGSSVGIRKVEKTIFLKEALDYAGQYDDKIIIEQGIEARELECAVLGSDNPIASCLGEVLPADEFYSFEAKYKNSKSTTQVPAKIEKKIEEKIKKMAIKAFQAVDGTGLARVDFFLEKQTGHIYLNEINTMPGFTKISMYPKLIQQLGISYSELLDQLIKMAMQ